MEETLGVSAEEHKHVPYAEVNGTWPKMVPIPSGPEAIAGARLLIREGFRFHEHKSGARKKWKFKLGSGNRHTWPRRGIWTVNPNYKHRPGWPGMVHSISHYVHRIVHPNRDPHDMHALTERHLIEYVIKNGWLDGKLKRPEKAKAVVDVRSIRHAGVSKRIKTWEAKQKRASTALKKLYRQKAYYERTLN